MPKASLDERLEAAILKLQSGDKTSLPFVYSFLANPNSDNVRKAAAAVAQYMNSLDDTAIINLSENFRQITSLDWTIDWKKVDVRGLHNTIQNKQHLLQTARLGTFHPNGYYREACINELKGDMSSFKYLILRLNDWVAPVRSAAESACLHISHYLTAPDLLSSLLYLEKVHDSVRRDTTFIRNLEDSVANRLHRFYNPVTWTAVKNCDPKTRKVFYRFLLSRKLLSEKEVTDLIAKERNGPCQRLLTGIFFEQYDQSPEELSAYMHHKSVWVQRKALEKKYRITGGYWAGLEESLLSPSKSVRGTVQFILQRYTQINMKEYYAERLDTSARKICILGISETGTAEDAGLIKPYLEDSAPTIVKNSLHALGTLLGSDGAEIFRKYLEDSRPAVAAQAYRETMASDIRYGAEYLYNLFNASDSLLFKKRIANLLSKEPYWDRLPYALMLYSFKDESIHDIIDRSIKRRYLYAHVSPEKADFIRSILDNADYGIPEKLKESTLFYLKQVT